MSTPSLTDQQKTQLLEMQFLKAMDGSEALMIHLGKAYLAQHDRQHLVVEAIPFAERNYEQLLEMLEERQKAIPDERLCDDLATMMLNPPAMSALPAPADEPILVIPKSDPPAKRGRGRPRKSKP